MISIESTAKTVQKAIEDGLAKLDKNIDEVDIKIISSGGLFKKAKVEITVIMPESPVEKSFSKSDTEQSKALAKAQPKLNSDGVDRSGAAKHGQKTLDNTASEKGGKDFKNAEKTESKAIEDGRVIKSDAFVQRPVQDKRAEGKLNIEHTHRDGNSGGFLGKAKEEKRDGGRENVELKQNQNQFRTEKTQPAPLKNQSGYAQPQKIKNRPEQKPDDGRADSHQPYSKANRLPEGYKSDRAKAEGANNERAKTEREERHERPRTEVTGEVIQKATLFVENLLAKMNIDFALTTIVNDGELTINIECDSGTVIGYRGETLDSIEYLTSLVINKNDDKYYRINVDCNDYRSKRVETLAALARRMAEKAVKTGRKVVLEPMSSSSRKIIHSILSENDRIITKSEGKDPTRRIIIIPKRFR